ncbi:MAG TPA: SUMF1/EgtB/PvdO family nonheme iron enzyme, partial [Dehalococcoidia bacterium]|nr:SUMF1/EgtB/PvdO family nonheme iron enzyme [Dehalococcoidia bacterium]
NEEYERFARATRHPLPKSLCRSEPPDHPVWGVSYDDAQSFAGWFGGEIGRSCRLPTEGEWEYAARGRLPREYPFGELFDPACCNTIHSGIGRTTPVHRYANGVSEFGVYDLAGNVEEWTADYYAPYTGGTFVHDDLSRQLGKRYRVLRGGSFARGGDLARCARRHGPLPAPEFCYIGFRLVATSSEGR